MAFTALPIGYIMFQMNTPEHARFRTPEFDVFGYFIFPGGNPGSIDQAEIALHEYGFTGCNPTYVAGSIVDGPEAMKTRMPQVETVVQVSFNGVVAYAIRVFPVTNPRNTEDFVKETFTGCSRQDDVLMIKIRESVEAEE